MIKSEKNPKPVKNLLFSVKCKNPAFDKIPMLEQAVQRVAKNSINPTKLKVQKYVILYPQSTEKTSKTLSNTLQSSIASKSPSNKS
jgi:hypothetical protein